MNCKACQDALPDLLFDPTAPTNAAAHAHISGCAFCAQELSEMEATLSLLDTWQVPAVSPYFDQKLTVRIREAQAEPAAGWFERLKTRLLLNTGRQLRPVLTTAMAVLLIIGGGSFGIANFQHPRTVSTTATVNDLQILDKNEQALQQVDQLLQEDTAATDTGATTPQS